MSCVNSDYNGVCCLTDEACEFEDDLHPEDSCEDFEDLDDDSWEDEE